MIIAYKLDKNTMIMIAAGAILACSGLWKIFDSGQEWSDTVNISVRHDETSAYTLASGNDTTATTVSAVMTEPDTPDDREDPYVDINSASEEELMKLHGVGEHIAQEIISYRESHGGFRNIEELMNVAGIGEAVFEVLRNQIYVVEPVYDEPTEPEPEQYAEVTEAVTEQELTLEQAAPININTADAKLLMLLPHVSEIEADEIIKLREGIGGFQSPYELLYVESLTTQEVAEIFEYIVLE